jgi:UTP--glucose-1-phosphate uridylyltransferase
MVKKAIIPAAGYGTRSLPITKVIPKEMFPIGEKPAIHYIVEEAVASGIEQILVVVSRTKSLIVDYFDTSLELESFLEKENKTHLIKELSIPDVQIYYTRQQYAKGLGDAINLGKEFINNEPFAVLLPDDIVISKNKPALKQLIESYEKKGSSVIGLNRVPLDELKNYGVVQGEFTNNHLINVRDIVEKPKADPPSDLAVIGRYVFSPAIFQCLEKLEPGAGGEVQLTDGIKKLLALEDIFGELIEGTRYDIGKSDEYVELLNMVYSEQKRKHP